MSPFGRRAPRFDDDAMIGMAAGWFPSAIGAGLSQPLRFRFTDYFESGRGDAFGLAAECSVVVHEMRAAIYRIRVGDRICGYLVRAGARVCKEGIVVNAAEAPLGFHFVEFPTPKAQTAFNRIHITITDILEIKEPTAGA